MKQRLLALDNYSFMCHVERKVMCVGMCRSVCLIFRTCSIPILALGALSLRKTFSDVRMRRRNFRNQLSTPSNLKLCCKPERKF
jgi:hypothetical protein